MNKDFIDPELLSILVCPACKSELELIEFKPSQHGLRCRECTLIYPIREGIPVMLVEEAIKS